jgi:hypothetical protein
MIFGPKREEVAGGWKRLHNEELHNFYASSAIITVVKRQENGMGNSCSMWER